MDYFDLNNFGSYIKEIGTPYDPKSKGAKFYYDTRSKLEYLANKIAKNLGIRMEYNYSEQPNKMAGQGKGFVLKEYILAGFIPPNLSQGKSIFLKISLHKMHGGWVFGLDIDVNFKDKGNPFNKYRRRLQKDANWKIPINDSFPDSWERLIPLVQPIFQNQLQYLQEFLSRRSKIAGMQEIIELLKSKGQIILQGPPGTGKTYLAKDLAEFMITSNVSTQREKNDGKQKEKLEGSGQFGLVQFHPSYSYEDFVRGITAKSVDGKIAYKAENKILASFAKKAKENLRKSNLSIQALTKEQWVWKKFDDFKATIQEELDDKGVFIVNDKVSISSISDDSFRYFGNNWKDQIIFNMSFDDLMLGFHSNVQSSGEFKALDGISPSAKARFTYYFLMIQKFQEYIGEESPPSPSGESEERKDFVLLIDEINRANLPSVLGELIYALEYRGEAVDTIYSIDGDSKISLPENLYIIGTMNTADRSVGHIDYAIKRRFAFINIPPKEAPILNASAKELFKLVSGLFVKEENGVNQNSGFLAVDYDFEDVQIGHSYFILKEGSEEEQKKQLAMRLRYEIVPLLREYVKDGLLLESAKTEIQKIERFGQ